ncbi:REP-associated tyrosine transposase [Pseudomonas japonica]|uniref:REP element-mobilizing transposase RayT n=1 Tax=Pseudomonas japonica TaxID=256466 RepID=A0A239JV12_9PSED|nr:transposase [Pseudomonas japonica]SNT09701.1 REP element-mobilizing transposase RayT [Pseudomonas japonica]
MSYAASGRLRLGRYSERGRLYLLTCQVEGRLPVFQELQPARMVIRQFRQAQDEGGIHSLAWVVMPDHIHWLVDLQRGSLACLMQRFKSRSARAVNQVRQGSGRLWQPGFHDRALRREEDVKAVARYIIANPLRAGLVERVQDYSHWDAVWL